MDKCLLVFENIQRDGFLHYFFMNHSIFVDTNARISKEQQMSFISVIVDSERWRVHADGDTQLMEFQMHDHKRVPLNATIPKSDLAHMIYHYLEPITTKTIAHYINISREEFRGSWIFDKAKQQICVKFRNLYGEGSTKKTYIGWHISYDIPIVVYQLSVPSNGVEQKRCLNEKRIAAIQKNPYLLTIYFSVAIRETQKVYMVADFFRHNVHQMILRHEKWSTERLQRFCIQILTGLECLHSMNVIHRDVKPSNIVYDDVQDRYQLIDFGVSTKFSSGIQINKIETLNCALPAETLSIVGTVGYISPEMFDSIYSLRNSAYTEKVDVFSFGITLLEMIIGERAFLKEFQDLPQRIEQHLKTREATLQSFINRETEYLHDLKLRLEDIIGNRRLERLRSEIYEKITILNHLHDCDDEERETMLSELIDKNKSISICCKKFAEYRLHELDDNTCDEYEFICKTKSLYSFYQKMESMLKKTSSAEWMEDFQMYPILFMTSPQDFPTSVNDVSDPLCQDFLRQCLHYDPARRSTIEQLLRHPWLIH